MKQKNGSSNKLLLGQALLPAKDDGQARTAAPAAATTTAVAAGAADCGSPAYTSLLQQQQQLEQQQQQQQQQQAIEPPEKQGHSGDGGGGAIALVTRGCVQGRKSSIESILDNMSRGSTIRSAGTEWRLTRAVVHLVDAWKGRVSPCPPLEKIEPATRALFKMRWKYQGLEFLVVHLLLSMSLVETPAWCLTSGRCFWSCYPDFSRNYHMSQVTATLIEGLLLLVLSVIALVDVKTCGRDYWAGSRKGRYQPMWFKHGTIASYAALFLLAALVDYRAHLVCEFCRILLYLAVHRRTVLVVIQLRHILGAVAEIWVLILFNIGLFAWVGVILFSGTEEGDEQFSDLYEASWRLFILFTTTNFPIIMMTALDQVRATIVFFAFFVILNVFFLAPLSLAFIFNVFRGGQSGIPQMEEEIRLRSTAAAFTLLDDRQSGQVSSANMGAFLLELHSMRGVASRELSRLQELIKEVGARTPEEAPSLTLQDFQDAVGVMDRSREHAEWITEIQWYYPQLYHSPGFRRLTRIVKHKRVTFWPGCCGTPQFSMLVIDAVDTFLLAMSFAALWFAKSFSASDYDSEQYDWVQISIVASFCVTVGLRAAVRGWYNCLQRPTWAFSALVTFFSVVVLVLAVLVPGEEWSWRLLRALRVTHMALAIAFVPRMAFLIRTLLTMTKRAATPASVLLAWSFFMAVLGTQIFGGKVCVPELAENDESCLGTTVASNTYTDTGLMLLNFNDVPTSFLTLLVLFVVNDWYVIVDEFVDVTGTGWARAFFIVNYIMGVAVILNLVVTVIINSFWDEYKNTNKPALAERQLHADAAASARYRPNPSGRGPASRPSAAGGSGDGFGDTCREGAAAAAAAAAATGENGGRDNSERRGVSAAGEGGDGAADGGGRGGTGTGTGTANTPHLPSARGGWGWQGVSLADEEKAVGSSEPPSRRGSREGSGNLLHGGGGGGGASQHLVLPSGEEAGMDAERTFARRASRKRLDVSGIT